MKKAFSPLLSMIKQSNYFKKGLTGKKVKRNGKCDFFGGDLGKCIRLLETPTSTMVVSTKLLLSVQMVSNITLAGKDLFIKVQKCILSVLTCYFNSSDLTGILSYLK